MDISSLENISAITKVVNPKENLETASKGVTEKDVAHSTDKTINTTKTQSPMELKLETQQAINQLLKSINKLLGEGVEKLPPQLKEQLANIIKQNTHATNLDDGLANLLRSQKNTNQDMLKLADTIVKNLFEHLESNTGTALPKNNLLSSLLKPESMFGDAAPKETLPTDKLVEKTLNEILAKTTDTSKEVATPPKNSSSEVVSDKLNPSAGNTMNKVPTESTALKLPEMMTTADQKPNANIDTKQAETLTNNGDKQTDKNSVAPKEIQQNNTLNTKQLPTKDTALLEQNTTSKTTVSSSEQNVAHKTTTSMPENILSSKTPPDSKLAQEKPAEGLPQNAKQATELKTDSNVLKNAVPLESKSETQMTSANRLIETLRLAENQALPKTNQEVQTLLLGLKDNLLKLTENNSQLNNLMQKFLQEGKELNKPETVLLNKFLNDNLTKLVSDNKLLTQQMTPKEATQVLQKNLLLNNNEQNQKDVELLNNLNKNVNTSEAAKQIKTQVESWSNTIKDLANTFIKSNQNSSDTSKSLQTSFAFMMNGEDGKTKPAHIHIYHEKKRRDNTIEKPAETWLKLSLDYEYAGEVNAIFHLKNESILDIKVSFSEADAIAPFKTFIPDIKNALADSKLSLTQIVAE